MSKQIISTDKAPAAIGPYSQATKIGNLIFTSGVIPVNPATGERKATIATIVASVASAIAVVSIVLAIAL